MSRFSMRKINFLLIFLLITYIFCTFNCSASAKTINLDQYLYSENYFDNNTEPTVITNQYNAEDIFTINNLFSFKTYSSDLPEIHTIINNDDALVNIFSQTSNDALITKKVEAGSQCYVVEAFIDGLWHHVICDDFDGYISTANLDLSSSEADYIFASEQDMRTKTGFSAEQLDQCLSDGMSGLGAYFAAAEQNYSVNALFLISICQIESCNGTSRLANNKHNLAGMKGRSGFINFASFEECINYMAEMLSSKYLDPQGAFYHGSTIKGVCVTYCGSSWYWVSHVSRMMQKNNDIISQQTATTV